MTETELKEIAKAMGYTVSKKPCYQCSCYVSYPNKSHKHKNGTWKCVDKYKPIKFERKGWYMPMTKCVKITESEGERE